MRVKFSRAWEMSRVLRRTETWDVILTTEFVEDRAANTRNREGAEGKAALRLECFEGTHQTHRAAADEFVEVRRSGERP
jgi:hypothetical protein